MKVRSVKTNYILNMIRLSSGILFGLITMPYITRVLGPDILGKIEYVNSIVSYFVLLSSLGIPIYGIKQIAKVRDNSSELSKVICELTIILVLTSLIAYIILFCFISFSSSLVTYKDLLVIMSSMILLTNIGMEWLYQGIEDQFYITIRTLIIRIISIILLFSFVKSSDDYLIYAVITLINLVGGNLLNLLRARKYVNLKDINFRQLNIQRHIRPALAMFIATISVSIYLQIDSFLLGYLTEDKYVGYYSIANKLIRFAIVLITTVGVVLLPRLTNLWENDKEQYYIILAKAFNILILLALPSSIYIYIFSNPIIGIMAGKYYQPAILCLKILSPLCILVAVAYFAAFLVLYVQGKEKVYTYIVSFGSAFSVLLNFVLIPKYFHNGAAVTQVLVELIGCILLIVYIYKNNLIQAKGKAIIDFNLVKVLGANLLLLIVFNIFAVQTFSIYQFLCFSIFFVILYFVTLYILKENFLYNFSNSLYNRVFKKQKYIT